MSENEIKSNHIKLGEKLSFQAGSGIESYLLDGWSVQELGHRWTEGDCARLSFQISDLGHQDIILRMECLGFLAAGILEYQSVDVLINEIKVTTWTVRQKAWYEAIVPNELIRNGEMNVSLLISDPTAPFDFNLSSDKRKLGLFVQSVQFVGSGNVKPFERDINSRVKVPKNKHKNRLPRGKAHRINSKKFLFICGCPRSGTTALTHVFNWHPKVFLGIERYAALFRRNSKEMIKNLFSPQRFFDIRKGDCGYLSFEQMHEYSAYYGRHIDQNDIHTASIIGDKITQLYEDFDVFDEYNWKGENVTIVQIIRNVFDVARSYEARKIDSNDQWKLSYIDGVKEWSHAIECGLHKFESNDLQTKFLIVNYENLFECGEEQFLVGCNKLIDSIGLDFAPTFENGLKAVYKRGKEVSDKRSVKTVLVSDGEIITQISLEALENYKKLSALAYI